MGELDNTLVIYLSADNGCYGRRNAHRNLLRAVDAERVPAPDHGTAAGKTRRVRRAGCLGRSAYGQPFSVAWAYASSTPFQWTKQMASHFGGTMSATAIRYPKAIEARGEWRRQFQNVTDLVPTILEVTGVPAPDYVNGQKRKAVSGQIAHLCLERCGCQNQPSHPVF
jgi:arylsulfatase A-like enzyme